MRGGRRWRRGAQRAALVIHTGGGRVAAGRSGRCSPTAIAVWKGNGVEDYNSQVQLANSPAAIRQPAARRRPWRGRGAVCALPEGSALRRRGAPGEGRHRAVPPGTSPPLPPARLPLRPLASPCPAELCCWAVNVSPQKPRNPGCATRSVTGGLWRYLKPQINVVWVGKSSKKDVSEVTPR